MDRSTWKNGPNFKNSEVSFIGNLGWIAIFSTNLDTKQAIDDLSDYLKKALTVFKIDYDTRYDTSFEERMKSDHKGASHLSLGQIGQSKRVGDTKVNPAFEALLTDVKRKARYYDPIADYLKSLKPNFNFEYYGNRGPRSAICFITQSTEKGERAEEGCMSIEADPALLEQMPLI